jgi:DUF177 domain-containing protein
MIKIKVSNLTNGRYDYNFEGKANDLDIPEPYVGNFNTNVALNKFDNQIILDAETGILTNLVCDRCARDFQSVVHSKFRMVYLFRFRSDDSADEKVDVVYLHPETDKIELDKDIRDFAILALPMKKLCTEDCKGLCLKCGKNLNDGPCNCVEEIVDPRWEVLQKLKTKNN